MPTATDWMHSHRDRTDTIAAEKAWRVPPLGAMAAHPRLKRLRALSILLDESIQLPFVRYRIGLDPLIGLVPGIGDFIATGLSFFLVYEGARLGLPAKVLLRMILNIAIEGILGTIPVAGDLFDAVWKSNVRNMRLIESSFHPKHRERSGGGILLTIILVFLGLFVTMAGCLLLIFKGLAALFQF